MLDLGKKLAKTAAAKPKELLPLLPCLQAASPSRISPPSPPVGMGGSTNRAAQRPASAQPASSRPSGRGGGAQRSFPMSDKLTHECGIALIVVLAVVAAWLIVNLRTDRPVTYAAIEDHFKYGSIGSEPGGSLLNPVGGVLPPYWVFKSLPSICRNRPCRLLSELR